MTALGDRVVRHLREVAAQPDLTGTRYRLIRTLGHGGMGSVYLVEDAELAREVALKVLGVPDDAGDLTARLVAEARLLARLEHPNIVPVHDAGRLADGRVYYAMKYVRGRRLDEWRAEGPTRPARLRMFQKVCGAVAFAHAHGVIHRDLKPDNIMIGPFGEALVMDWGVARLMPGAGDRGGEAAAEEGAVIGTPAWMAPEQARGETDRIDQRTDVYALGAILHYLLAGDPPSGGGASARTTRSIGEDAAAAPSPPAPPAARLSRDVPAPLRSVCLKALAGIPADRYASAEEMSADVERFLDGLPVSAHRETPIEKAGRIFQRHRLLIELVAAYILMRAMVIAMTGR